MKKWIKVILVILSFLPCFIKAKEVKTKECDRAYLAFKKTLAENVSWSYEYYLVKNKMYFDITVSNVNDDLYVVDESTGKKYTKTEFKIEKLADDQKLKFRVYSKECNNEEVASKDVLLPTYNKYSDTEYCKGINEFFLCRRWQTVSSSITEDDLKKQTDEYRESLKPKDVKAKEYIHDNAKFYTFTGLILLALILLLIIIVHERREKDFI